MRNDRKLDVNEVISRFRLKHGNKYEYIMDNYNGLMGNKIKIICPIHGVFEQLPKFHTKYGCKSCGGNKPLMETDIIPKLREIHGDKYEYKIPKIFNSKTKIEIECPTHGSFTQKISNHINNKQGCPLCKVSKGENIIYNYLRENGIESIRQKTFSGCVYKSLLKFDFYIPSKNIAIEFDGAQHLYPIELFGGQDYLEYIRICDGIKTKWCSQNAIRLIRISHKEINKIKKILKEEI